MTNIANSFANLDLISKYFFSPLGAVQPGQKVRIVYESAIPHLYIDTPWGRELLNASTKILNSADWTGRGSLEITNQALGDAIDQTITHIQRILSSKMNRYVLLTSQEVLAGLSVTLARAQEGVNHLFETYRSYPPETLKLLKSRKECLAELYQLVEETFQRIHLYQKK